MMLPLGESAAKSAGIAVRAMRVADVSAVLSILRESPEASMWAAKSLSDWCSGGDAWVAELNDGVAGILIARAVADEMEILNLGVAKAYRRQGVGARLVRAALDRAHAAGARRVYLELRASNAGGSAFYERMGFRECGRRPNYYQDPPEDAILLVLKQLEGIR